MTEAKRVVWVAGGAGFIGHHLCRRLVQGDRRVVCIDDLSTGSIENIERLLESQDFQLLRANVMELPPAPLDQGIPLPGTIINLASPASPREYQRDPERTLLTNIEGTRALLEIAKRTGCSFLQASTSEIYGSPPISSHPQSEQYWGNVNPIGPRACYDEGKRAAETLLSIASRAQPSVRVGIARIFNTYGPGMSRDDGRVVPTFLEQALHDRPITVHGDGSQTRSFCYVGDAVEALLRFMTFLNTVQDSRQTVMNVGNPEETPIRRLAEITIQLTKSRSPIRFVARPSEDPDRRLPDISRISKLLDWTPRISLLEGLSRTVRWRRSEGQPSRGVQHPL